MRSLLATLLMLVGWGSVSALAPPDPDSAPEAVILLHGLARTDRSMRPLEEHLTGASSPGW